MFEILLAILCVLGIAMLAVPIGITFGTRRGIALALALSVAASVFVYGDQAGARPGGDRTPAFRYDHGEGGRR